MIIDTTVKALKNLCAVLLGDGRHMGGYSGNNYPGSYQPNCDC